MIFVLAKTVGPLTTVL